MRVLVTGDRSMPLALAVPVAAIQLLKLVNDNTSTEVLYGNCVGVEQAVGLVIAAANVEMAEQFQYPIKDDGRPDFTAAYETLKLHGVVDKVVVIHGDLHASRIFKAAVEVFGEDKVETVSPELLFV